MTELLDEQPSQVSRSKDSDFLAGVSLTFTIAGDMVLMTRFLDGQPSQVNRLKELFISKDESDFYIVGNVI